MWGFFVATYVLIMLCWLAADITVLKCLYIWRWPWMSLLDDYFLTRFLLLFHSIYSFMIIGIRYHLGDFHENPNYLFLTNQPTTPIGGFKDRVFFWSQSFPGIVLIMLIISASILAILGKKKHHNAVANLNPAFNNNAHNENIVNVKSSFTIIAAVLGVISPFLVLRHIESVASPVAVTTMFVEYVIMCLIFPSMYFIKKPQHFKSAIAEMFP